MNLRVPLRDARFDELVLESREMSWEVPFFKSPDFYSDFVDGVHRFPSRTRKLSLLEPMILHLSGVGN